MKGRNRERINERDTELHFVHSPSRNTIALDGVLSGKLSGAPKSPLLQPRSGSPYFNIQSAHPASSPPIFLRKDGSLSPSYATANFVSSTSKLQKQHQHTHRFESTPELVYTNQQVAA